MTAQEVDPGFVAKLRAVRESDNAMWHVAVLEPEDHKTCVIAARTSWSTGTRMKERHVTHDGEYKVKGRKAARRLRGRGCWWPRLIFAMQLTSERR